jgi:hypothetical protein
MKPEELAKFREKSCFPRKNDILTAPPPNGMDVSQANKWRGSHFKENSSYFRLTSVITLGGSDFALYSLLFRGGSSSQSGQGKVRVLQRSFTAD